MLVSHGRVMNHSSANPGYAKKLDIRFILLNDKYQGGQPTPDHYDLTNDEHFDISQISSGELFLAIGGSVWLDGALKWLPQSKSSKRADNKGLSFVTLIGNKGYLCNSKALHKDLGAYATFFDESSWMYASKQKDGSNVLIPAAELFRFYWAGSKSFSSDLLNNRVENLDNFCVLKDSRLRENGDAEVVVRKKYRKPDAKMIARMICSERNHPTDKYSIAHLSAMHPFYMWKDKTKPTYIQANFPFNDETTIIGYGVKLGSGKLLILSITHCSHRFLSGELYVRMDDNPIELVHPRQGESYQKDSSLRTGYEDNAPQTEVNSDKASDDYEYTDDIEIEDNRFNLPKIRKLSNPNEKKKRVDFESSGVNREQKNTGEQSLTPGGYAGDLPGTNLSVGSGTIGSLSSNQSVNKQSVLVVINVGQRVAGLFEVLQEWQNNKTKVADQITVKDVQWRISGNELDIGVKGVKAISCPYLPLDFWSDENKQENENNKRAYGSKLRWIAVIELTLSVDGADRTYYLIEIGAKNTGYALNLLFKPPSFGSLDENELTLLVNGFRRYFSKQVQLVNVFDIRDTKQAKTINRIAINHSRGESAMALANKVIGKIV